MTTVLSVVVESNEEAPLISFSQDNMIATVLFAEEVAEVKR